MQQLSTIFSEIVFSAIFAGIYARAAALAYLGNKSSTGVMDLNGTDTSSMMGEIWK